MRVAALCAAAVVCSMRLSAESWAPAGQIDTATVAAFADDFFPSAMAARHIPGLVFVFVSGGEIAIKRGFGVAELDPRRSVDPDHTQFGLASVSKTITATAALQLVERGRLDLHSDVNTYLESFQLSARHGRITLHHLLTHTAGFDERLTGVAARSAGDLLPSSLYLASAMPPTFIQPGRVISYSNHGFALIGHLVEEVSRRPFAEYVRAEIFEPLGMSASGALSGPIPNELAVAYEHEDGQHRALAPDYLQISSAGFFYTTGADMGRFLIAHLRAGSYGDRRILRPETAALMHAQQFAQIPEMSGWAYGLWEDARNDERALLHNGGGKGYRALMYLLPQRDAGFFIAYNLADRHEEGELQEVFITQFRNRFVRSQQIVNTSSPESVPTAPLAGDYVYVRRARTTVEKFIAIVNRVRITADEGNLMIAGAGGDRVCLIPIGGQLFRRVDGRGVVGFDADVAGKPERLLVLLDSGFPAVYERIPLFATLRVQLAALGLLALIFFYAGIWRPVASLVRKTDSAAHGPGRWFMRVAALASALNLVFIIGFPLAFFGRMEGGVPEFLYGVPTAAAALLLIPPVTGCLAVAALVLVARLPLGAEASVARRVWRWLIVVALLAFVMLAWYWRLLQLPGVLAN